MPPTRPATTEARVKHEPPEAAVATPRRPPLEPVRRLLNGMPICDDRRVVCERLGRGSASLAMRTPRTLLGPAGEVPWALVLGLGDMAAAFSLHTTVSAPDMHLTTALTMSATDVEPCGELTASGSALLAGRRQAFAEATVRDARGRACAVFSGTFAVLANSPHAVLRPLLDADPPDRSTAVRRALAPAAVGPSGVPLLNQDLGIDSSHLSARGARVSMTPRDGLRHPSGAVPGVLIGALAERAAQLATGTGPAALVSLAIQFMRPALSPSLRADSERLAEPERDPNLAVTRAAVRDEAGELVALAIATWTRRGPSARPGAVRAN